MIHYRVLLEAYLPRYSFLEEEIIEIIDPADEFNPILVKLICSQEKHF